MGVHQRHSRDQRGIGAVIQNKTTDADGDELRPLDMRGAFAQPPESEEAVAYPCDRGGGEERDEAPGLGPHAEQLHAELQHADIDAEADDADNAEFQELDDKGAIHQRREAALFTRH